MYTHSSQKFFTVAAAGLVALTAASLGFGRSRPVAAPRPGTQLAVAETLDRVVQPRFQDDRVGVFGLSRMYIPGDLAGHGTIASFQAKDPKEARLFREVANAGRDYLIGFIYTAHSVGRFRSDFVNGQVVRRKLSVDEKDPTRAVKPSLRVLVAKHAVPAAPEAPQSTGGSAGGGSDFNKPPVAQSAQAPHSPTLISPSSGGRFEFPDPTVMSSQEYLELQNLAVTALPPVTRGRHVDLKYKDWMVALRPVRAEKASCIECHTGAKLNDTLGVMMYVVSDKQNQFAPPPAKVSAF